MGSSDPSPLQQKLARNIRVFVSNYLQQHLLTLPSLPTKTQLQEIKDRLEREAQERLKEIEHQRELQHQREEQQRLCEGERQRNAAREKFTSDMDKLFSVNTLKNLGKEIKSIVPGEGEKAGEKAGRERLKEEEQKHKQSEEHNRKTDRTEEKSGRDYFSAGFKKFTSDVDKLFSVNTIKDLGKNIVPGKNEEEEQQEGGWKIDSQRVVHSMDLDEGDPFAVQREQLLSFIAQAKEAKRFDEVRALECSLQEIESVMREQRLSHGFS